MIWYPSKTYNRLKWVREYATLHPHLNYKNANNDAFESGNEIDDDAVESKSKSINDAVESTS